MTDLYVWVSAGAFIALGLVWSNKGDLNIVIKLSQVGLGVWGLYCAFH